MKEVYQISAASDELFRFPGVRFARTLVASGGKVPKKSRGCNRSHIPKALEHPIGLP